MCLAVPGKIIEITQSDPMMKTAKVSFSGIVKDINVSLVPDAKIGDYILAHVGYALSVIDEEEAKKTMEYLKEMDDLENKTDDPL